MFNTGCIENIPNGIKVLKSVIQKVPILLLVMQRIRSSYQQPCVETERSFEFEWALSWISLPTLPWLLTVVVRGIRRLPLLTVMMTSSNGNIFRVTGLLCGEFIGRRWIPLTKASNSELWCFLSSAPCIKGWVNNREVGDLRRHHAHYDVIVM